jgi:tetratricopeptide (TPR) repeat protein
MPFIQQIVHTRGSEKGVSAACYLAELPEEVLGSFNRLWNEAIADNWRAGHQYIQQARQRLTELEKKSETEPLTLEECWQMARDIGETRDPQTALPVIRRILEQSPNHAAANLAAGALLLREHDSAGLLHLEKAIELDPSTTGSACEAIYDFYREQGRQDEADAYRRQAEQYYDKVERRHEEAMNLTVHDHFAPHGLSNDELSDLQKQLLQVRGLARAWLVCKIVDEDVEPIYVLAVLAGQTWRNGRSEKNAAALLNELAASVKFLRPIVFVSLDVKAYLEKRFREIPEAEIYNFVIEGSAVEPGRDPR